MLADPVSALDQGAMPARSFAALMDMYEQNYLRLRTLIPDSRCSDHMVSHVEGCLDLHLDIVERCKFTTILTLNYRFMLDGEQRLEPDLHIRLYHDARIAEALHRVHHRHHRLIQSGDSLRQRWLMNRFLYKWLGYCHRQGHFFVPIQANSPQP